MYTKTHSGQEQKQQLTVCASDDYGAGFLRYDSFSHISNRFSRRQTAQLSSFFQYGANRGPQNAVHFIAVSVRCTKIV